MASTLADLTPKARKTRSALLTAAKTLIGRDGLPRVNVMAVCAEAAVGRTSFYNYFEDADALIAAVALQAANEIKDRFDQLHAGHPRGLSRLGTCLEMILMLAIDEPDMVLMLTSLARTTPQVRELLEAEITAELSADPICPREDAAALSRFLTIATLALSRQFAEGKLPEDSVGQQLEYLMRACG